MVYSPDNSKVYHETFVDNSIEYHENIAKELNNKLDTLINFKKELVEDYKSAPKKQKPIFEKKIKATDKQISGTTAQRNQASETSEIWNKYKKNIANETTEDFDVVIGNEKWKSSLGSLIGTNIEIEYYAPDSTSRKLALKVKKSLNSKGYPASKIKVQPSNSGDLTFPINKGIYKINIEYCDLERSKYEKLKSLLLQDFKMKIAEEANEDCTGTKNPMIIKVQ